MTPSVLDIYWVQIQLRKCNDVRPCVVVHVGSNGKIEVASISSQNLSHHSYRDFVIDSGHSNFASTGLHRTSYVVSGTVDEVERTDLKRRLGRLEGDLARDFKDWYGL